VEPYTIICFIADLGGEKGKWDHEGLSKEKRKKWFIFQDHNFS
jgi:hypothetical protein